MSEGSNQDVSTPRRSLGGHVVEAGLSAAGYDIAVSDEVALVETAPPRRKPYRVVLAQNAWNVVELATFWRLLRKHPVPSWPRYVMRRVIATVNLRRSSKVVCLTHAMGAMCRSYARNVVISPVTVPADFLAEPAPPTDETWSDTVLVPGTVTWHKNPVAAIKVVQNLQANGHGVNNVVFGGSDDGSGCWQEVESAASAAGIDCLRRQLSRREMATACASAFAVVVPSALESLSLSVAEALLTAPRVLASDIPAHRELAHRIGRQPLWLTADGEVEDSSTQFSDSVDPEKLLSEWRTLGRSLELEPAP